MLITYKEFEEYALKNDEEGLFKKLQSKAKIKNEQYYEEIFRGIIAEHCQELYKKTTQQEVTQFIERFCEKQIEEFIAFAKSMDNPANESEMQNLYPMILSKFKALRNEYQETHRQQSEERRLEEEKLQAAQKHNQSLPQCIQWLKNGDSNQLLRFLQGLDKNTIRKAIGEKDEQAMTILDHMLSLGKELDLINDKVKSYQYNKRQYHPKDDPLNKPLPYYVHNNVIINFDEYERMIKNLNLIYIQLIKYDIPIEKSNFDIISTDIDSQIRKTTGYYDYDRLSDDLRRELQLYKERNLPIRIKTLNSIFQPVESRKSSREREKESKDNLQKLDDLIHSIASTEKQDINQLFEVDFDKKTLLDHAINFVSYWSSDSLQEKLQILIEIIFKKMLHHPEGEKIIQLSIENECGKYNSEKKDHLERTVKNIQDDALYRQQLAEYGPSICKELYDGNIDALNVFINKDTNVNLCDIKKNTILHHLMMRLIARLHDLPPQHGFTLTPTLTIQDKELAQINDGIIALIKMGADIELKNSSENTPLDILSSSYNRLAMSSIHFLSDLRNEYKKASELVAEQKEKEKLKKEIKNNPKLIRLIRKKKFQDAMLYVGVNPSTKIFNEIDSQGNNAYHYLIEYLFATEKGLLDTAMVNTDNISIEDRPDLLNLLQTFVIYNENAFKVINDILQRHYKKYHDSDIYLKILNCLEVNQKKPQEAFSTALFAHIHNDPQLKGSHLEGYVVFKSSSYLLHVLNKVYKDYSVSSSLREKIKNNKNELKNLSHIAKRISVISQELEPSSNKTEELQVLSQEIIDQYLANPTKSISMPGGWNGDQINSGHAMIYQLKQSANGETHLIIYNTGAGIENHKTEISADNIKYSPAMAINLGKTDALNKKELEGLIQHLMTPLTQNSYEEMVDYNKKEYKPYNEDYLYQSIISKAIFLGGQIVDPAEFIDHAIVPQYSGTCSWSVFMKAWLESILTSNETEELEYHIKKESMKEFILTNKIRNSENNEVICQQVFTAVENFYKLINKLRNNEAGFQLSKKQFISDCQWLEEIEKSIPHPEKYILTDKKWTKEKPTVVSLVKETSLPDEFKPIKERKTKEPLSERINATDPMNFGTTTTIHSALEKISKLDQLCKQFHGNQQYHDLITEFVACISQFDISMILDDASSLKKSTFEENQLIMKRIQQLMIYFSNALMHTQETVTPKEMTAAYCLLGIADSLSKVIFYTEKNKDGLPEFTENISGKLKKLATSVFSASYDPLVDKNMHYLLSHFKPQSSPVKLGLNEKKSNYESLYNIIIEHPNVANIVISSTISNEQMYSEDKKVYILLDRLQKYYKKFDSKRIDDIDIKKLFPELVKNLEPYTPHYHYIEVEDVDLALKNNNYLEQLLSEISGYHSEPIKAIIIKDKSNKAAIVSKQEKSSIKHCYLENIDFNNFENNTKAPRSLYSCYHGPGYYREKDFESPINEQFIDKIGIDRDLLLEHYCPKEEIVSLINKLELALRFQFIGNLSSSIFSSDLSDIQNINTNSELTYIDVFRLINLSAETIEYGKRDKKLTIKTTGTNTKSSLNFDSAWYDKFKSPLIKKALGDFIYFYDKYENDREKTNKILTKKAYVDALDQDTDLARTLLQARSNPTIQIVSFLDFANQNIAQFTDIDWQRLLQLTLFEPGVLTEQIQRNPNIVNDIHQMIRKGLHFAIHTTPKDLNTFCYFSHLNLLLTQYVERLPIKDTLIPFEILNNEIFELQQEVFTSFEKEFLDSTPTLKKDNLPLNVMIHFQKLLTIMHQMQNSKIPSDEIVHEFIKSMVLVEAFKYKLPSYQNELLREMQYKMKPFIRNLYDNPIEKSKNILLLKEIITQYNLSSQDISQYDIEADKFPILTFLYEDKPILFVNLNQFKINLLKTRIESFPSDIQNESPFKDYFHTNLLPINCSMYANNRMFEFDYLNQKYRYTRKLIAKERENNQDGIIERKFNINDSQKWYTLIQPNSKEWNSLKPWLSTLPKTLIENERNIWLRTSKDGSIQLIFSSSNHEPEYIYDTKTQQLNLLNDHKITDNQLILLQKDTGQLELSQAINQENATLKDYCTMLSTFEDPNFIECTINSETKEAKIRLPRYNLTFTAKEIDNNLVLCLADNPNVRIDISGYNQNPFKEFKHYLPLQEQSESGQIRKFVYLPKQLFYAESLEHSGPYYQLKFDTSHHVNQQKSQLPEATEFGIPDPQTNPSLWKFTNEESFLVYSTNEDNTLRGESFVENIYLAYVYLGSHQPVKAFEVLQNIEKKGLTPKTIDELTLLTKLISNLPEKLGNADLEERVKPDSPTYIAVKSKALHLAIKYQFSAGSKAIPLNETALSTILSEGNRKIADFDQSNIRKYFEPGNFIRTLYENYDHYYNHKNFIPDDMKLSDKEEFEMLQVLVGQNKKLAFGHIGRRYQELKKWNLYVEKENIEAIQHQLAPQELPKNLSDRLNVINQKLTKSPLIVAKHTAVITTDYIVPPPSIKEINSLKNIVHPELNSTYTYEPSTKSRYSYTYSSPVIRPSDLSLNTTDEEFLKSVHVYIDLILNPKIVKDAFSKWTISQEQERLEKFIQNYLLAHDAQPSIASNKSLFKTKEEEPTLALIACRFLFYIQKYPDRFRSNINISKLVEKNNQNLARVLEELNSNEEQQGKLQLQKMSAGYDFSLSSRVLTEFESVFVSEDKDFKFEAGQKVSKEDISKSVKKALQKSIFMESEELDNLTFRYLLSNKSALEDFLDQIKQLDSQHLPKIELDDRKIEIWNRYRALVAFKSLKGTDEYSSLLYQIHNLKIEVDSKAVATHLANTTELLKGSEFLKAAEEIARHDFATKSSVWQGIASNKDPVEQLMIDNFEMDCQRGKEINRKLDELKALSLRSWHLPKDRENIKQILEAQLQKNQEDNKTSFDIKQKILDKFNHPPTQEPQRSFWLSKRQQFQNKDITFDKILHLYLMGEISEFRECCVLNDNEINELNVQITEYLLQATQEHQYQNILNILDELNSILADTPMYNEKLSQLGTLLSAHRSYDDYYNNRAFLLYEYMQKIMIFPEQMPYLEILLKNKDGSYSNDVIQLIMGGGKSKVLMPLIAVLKANGRNLSIIEVPDALLESNAADLFKVTKDVFGVSGKIFQFSRHQDSNSKQLNLIYKMFRDSIVNKEYIVTTANSIQALELKYLELIFSYPHSTADQEENAKQIRIIEKILTLLEQQGDVLIDEIDAILKISQEFNYTLGGGENLSLQYREDAVAFFSYLETLTFTVNDINLDIHDIMMGTTEYPENHHNIILKSIVVNLMTSRESPIYNILNSLSVIHRKQIHKFLIGELHDPKEVAQYIGSLSPRDRNKLALYKEQLATLAPLAFSKKLNVNYGPSLAKETSPGRKEVAIPYYANMCPSEGSEFGNIDLTTNLTILMQRRNGLSEFVIKEMIQHYIQEANNELKAKNWTLTPDETESAKAFEKITGIPLFKINLNNHEEFEVHYNEMKSNKKVVEHCLVHHVLNNISVNTKVLRTDRINHIARFCTSQGMSGTTSSYKTWHNRLHFNPQGPGFGTDGRTVDTLLKKVKDNNIIFSKEYRHESILELLAKHENFRDFRAIIDAGTCFQGIPNFQVANQLATFYEEKNNTLEKHIKFILYYNTENKLSALPVGGGSPIILTSTLHDEIQSKLKCDIDQCFTYYDQPHTVGADIKQKPYARAFVTVNETTSLRDFVQAVMRMRDLSGTQEIDLVISDKLRGLYPHIKEWNILAVVNALFDIQKNQLLDDHFTAALKNMDNVVRQKLFRFIKNTKDPAIKSAMLNEWQNHFMLNAVLDSYFKYSLSKQSSNTLSVLEEYSKNLISNYTACLEKFSVNDVALENTSLELNNIVNDYSQYCRETIDYVPRENVNSEVVAEAEKQQQLKVQLEQKQLQVTDAGFELKALNYINWQSKLRIENFRIEEANDSNVKVFPLEDMCKDIDRTWSFDKNIAVSDNFARTYENQAHLLDDYRKSIYAVLVIKEGEHFSLLVLTPEEAEFFTKKIDDLKQPFGESNKSIWIESPSQTKIAGFKPNNFNKNEQIHYQHLFEQVRLFNGDCNLLSERLNKTQGQHSWLMDKNMNSKIHFLKDHILPTQPNKKKQFGFLVQTTEQLHLAQNRKVKDVKHPTDRKKPLLYKPSKDKTVAATDNVKENINPHPTRKRMGELTYQAKSKLKPMPRKSLDALDLQSGEVKPEKKNKDNPSGPIVSK